MKINKNKIEYTTYYYREYCIEYPVRKTKYGNYKDRNNSVGEFIDQYETLEEFAYDIFERYRPFGGKCYFEKSFLVQIKQTKLLICKDIDSKFYKQTIDNPYIIYPKVYNELRQHYFLKIEE